ncbi:hypothetical protein [Sphingopyxis kveilinensis]
MTALLRRWFAVPLRQRMVGGLFGRLIGMRIDPILFVATRETRA